MRGTVLFNFGHSAQHRWLYKDWSHFYVMDDFGNLSAVRHRFERMHYSLLGY